MYYWGQGFLLGLAYVAPIGMQNLFVLNNALLYQRRQAFFAACVVIFFLCDVIVGLFFRHWRPYGAICLAANRNVINRRYFSIDNWSWPT